MYIIASSITYTHVTVVGLKTSCYTSNLMLLATFLTAVRIILVSLFEITEAGIKFIYACKLFD